MKTLLCLLTTLFISSNAFAVDLVQIEKDLNAGGVMGWIHGAAHDQGLYVFTYRNPADFFDYVEMSLVADQPEVLSALKSFGRNDKVLVKGTFLKNPSPQKHVKVAAIRLLQKFVSPYPSLPYDYEAKIPDDLAKDTSATFLVHAVAGDGQILVLEYKDAVVPVYVTNPELTKKLFRNDLVTLAYRLKTYPDRPTHLELDTQAPQPVKVLQSIQSFHGKPAVVEGALILFPKSPEIIFNVFAVQEELIGGLKRQYTIVNMDNPDVFAQIRAKLQKAWDKFPGEYGNARNKLVSRRLRVRVSGVYNEVSAAQANPQVLVPAADKVEVLEN